MKLPLLYIESFGGKTYAYVRRGRGQRIRITAKEGTPEFFREYADAVDKLNRVAQEERLGRFSLRYLVAQYYAHHSFASLNQATRVTRRNVIEQFLPGVAREDYRRVNAARILRLLDEKINIGKPEAAQTRLKALRALFDFALTRGLVASNPARDPAVAREMRGVHSRNRDGHKTWRRADIEQFRARWKIGTKQRLAFELAFWTGARVSDLCRLGPAHTRREPGWLVWKEAKGRDRYEKQPTRVPISRELRAALDATATGDIVFLMTQWGRAFTVKGFGQWFVRSARAAGLPRGLTAHGVRKAAATILAESGASEYELMSVFGWTSARQASVYTRKIDRSKLAKSALAKLEKSQYKKRTGCP